MTSYILKLTLSFSNQAVFSTWTKSQDKKFNILRRKKALRWNKKHFSPFLKGFHWTQQNYFFEGWESDFKHLKWRVLQQWSMAAVSYYAKLFTLDVCRVTATSLQSQSKIFVKKIKAPPQKQLFADVLQKRCSLKISQNSQGNICAGDSF